jgi:hypothetical protein
MKPKIILSLVFIIAIVGTQEAHTYRFIDFGADEYIGSDEKSLQRMRTNLGIDGWIIEDFDDATFIPGLTMSGNGALGLSAVNYWGATGTGSYIFITKDDVTASINIEGGTSKIGIGFERLEYDASKYVTELSLNEGATIIDFTPENFPNFIFAVAKTGYLIIEVEPGDELISSMHFRTKGNPSDRIIDRNWDRYWLDYVAVVRLD